MIDLTTLREELLQCRRCGLCRDAIYPAQGFDGVCPVWRSSSGFETGFMRGKIMVALALMDGVLERTSANAHALFSCTLCGGCAEICPAEFHPARAIERVRATILDIANEERDSIANRIIQSGCPYPMTSSVQKREWTSSLGADVPISGEVLYFVGCTSSIRLPKTAIDTARLLYASGTDFAVMQEEPCCGSVMFRTGRLDDAVRNARRVASAISATGAEKIIVSCAGCLKTLREDYPELGIELPEVQHIVEFADDAIKEGRLHLRRQREQIRATYHDPCHMGRGLGIYEPPREILRSIGGINLVEMVANRHAAICCGAGGGLRSFDGELSKRIATNRIRDAEAVGADVIVTACPFCQMNLDVGRQLINSHVRVADIIELVVGSLGLDT